MNHYRLEISMNPTPDPQDRATPSPFSQIHKLSLVALVLGAVPSAGCTVDAADDEATAEAQGASSTETSGLDFGGAFGYVGGAPVPNPATGAASCPGGYTAVKVMDTPNIDYPVHFCFRPRQAGSDPVFDFGGMWGYVGGALANNPITGAASCPAGFTDQLILDTFNIDYPLHVCYRPHAAGTPSPYHFGGMWGYVNGAPVPNPATGAASCPPLFAGSQVLGTTNVDYPLHVCWQLRGGKFTAQGQIAAVGPYTQVTVSATFAPGGSMSFLGHAASLAAPGANGTWGDLYTDDLFRLYQDTVSFQFNTVPVYTNVNFFDANSNYLGSYHGGGVGIVTGTGGGTGTFSAP
jgi:hypothetical protein